MLGRPVSLVALDAALGWPAQRVATVLEQAPGTEYDEQGNILGLALTLRETPHVFEVEGRRLYTWCALDTLMFPVLIGKTARVASRCANAGYFACHSLLLLLSCALFCITFCCKCMGFDAPGDRSRACRECIRSRA